MKALVAYFGLLLLILVELSQGYYLNFDVDPADDAFLDELERASFLFFWEQANPETGQIKDRAFTNGTEDNRPVSSIASTGFGLSSFVIAHKRNYHDRAKIEERIRITLDFILNKLDGYKGFYYHFVDMHTGKRVWDCELSSIDTAILINGVLTVRSYFYDNQLIRNMCTQIYERVDYEWMLNGGVFLSMGWFPERGFLQDSWNRYCELMMLLIQAIGSPKHSISIRSWFQFIRPLYDYKNISYLSYGDPLFVHQFSHAWIDFYNNTDLFTDYFENSVNATKAHKLWSITELAASFSTYSENYWGITASDTPYGYDAWGGPPLKGGIDGSVVPCAAAGSIPFLPKETLAVLKNLKQSYPRSWDRYGFIDAFNPATNWYNPDVIGIDVGITMLMAENYRTGLIWELFMKNKEILDGMRRVGFSIHPSWKPNSSVRNHDPNYMLQIIVCFIFVFRNLFS